MQDGHIFQGLPERVIQAADQHGYAQQHPAHFHQEARQGIGRVAVLGEKEPDPAADQQQPAQYQAEHGKLAGAFVVRGAPPGDGKDAGRGGHKAHSGESQQH